MDANNNQWSSGFGVSSDDVEPAPHALFDFYMLHPDTDAFRREMKQSAVPRKNICLGGREPHGCEVFVQHSTRFFLTPARGRA